MLYRIIRGILILFLYGFYRPTVRGLHHIPAEGSGIVYSNHISLLDPIFIGCILHRRIYFMAKQELFRLPGLSAVFRALGAFPVKRGKADMSAIKRSLQVLKEDKLFGIFPEGTRSKSGEMKAFSHGIASIAIRSQAPVIPVAITGEYRLFRRIYISIGEPLTFPDFYGKRTGTDMLETVSSAMSEAILALKTEKTPPFHKINKKV